MTDNPRKRTYDPRVIATGQKWRRLDKRSPGVIVVASINMLCEPPAIEYKAFNKGHHTPGGWWETVMVRLDEFLKLYEHVDGPEAEPRLWPSHTSARMHVEDSTRAGSSACGYRMNPSRLTKDRSAVTCGRCQRTYHWKQEQE